MLIFVLLIMACSLIGTVLLIGVCAPLSAAAIPTSAPIDGLPQIVIEEPFREDRGSNVNCEDSMARDSIGKDTIISYSRKWIASRSVPVLRSRGMTDEEIKAELLRDFPLTEEQVDEIIAAQ